MTLHSRPYLWYWWSVAIWHIRGWRFSTRLYLWLRLNRMLCHPTATWAAQGQRMTITTATGESIALEVRG